MALTASGAALPEKLAPCGRCAEGGGSTIFQESLRQLRPVYGGPPQQQLMPVPMQQPAVNVNVATAVPMQQPMQQPMMVPVMVTCPLGLKPGDMLQAQSPDGQMMQVQVPPGVMPGGQFAVQMPAAPVVAMAAPVQAVDTSGVAMPMPV